jgi:Trypsin-co-occurring domain 2
VHLSPGGAPILASACPQQPQADCSRPNPPKRAPATGTQPCTGGRQFPAPSGDRIPRIKTLSSRRVRQQLSVGPPGRIKTSAYFLPGVLLTCRIEGVAYAHVYAQACITFHVQPARLPRNGNCCGTFSCRRIEPDRRLDAALRTASRVGTWHADHPDWTPGTDRVMFHHTPNGRSDVVPGCRSWATPLGDVISRPRSVGRGGWLACRRCRGIVSYHDLKVLQGEGRRLVADSAGVGLADAVRALRAELTSAMTEGADQALRFELGPVEMEFLLEVNREAGGQGGVRFWVVSLGGSGSVARGSTHRVTLQLAPRTSSGEAPLIRDVER